MKKFTKISSILLGAFAGMVIYEGNAQNVGIGTVTPNAKSILDLTSTTQGFLMPRMTTAQRTAIAPGASEAGLLVYDTSLGQVYQWNGAAWTAVGGADNLGNHTATTNIQLGTNYLSGDGGNEGITVNTVGNVGIGTTTPSFYRLSIHDENPFVRIQDNVGTGNVAIGGLVFTDQAGAGTFQMDYQGATARLISWVGGSSLEFLNNTGSGTTTKMTIRGSNGYVGIGTQTPDQLLTISNATNPIFRFDRSNGGAFDWELSAGGLGFQINGGANGVGGALTNFLTIDGFGKVGIGNAAPTERLDVTGNVRFSGALMPNNLAGTAGQVLTSAGAGVAPTWTTISTGLSGTGTATEVAFWNGATSLTSSSSLYWDNTNTRLGIGLNSPLTNLHISGMTPEVLLQTTSNAFNIGYRYKTAMNEWFMGQENGFAGTFSIRDIGNTATRFVINPSGNVGIGNTAPTEALDVTGNVKFSGALMPNNMAGTAGQVLTSAGPGVAPTWTSAASGTVTSVGLTAPGIFTVSGSPVTTSGSLGLTLTSQAANTVFAAPNAAAGTPTFRTLVANDIPSLDASKITTGILPLSRGGTNAGLTATNGGVVYSTATAFAITPAGTSGQVLTSNGAGAPTWATLGTLSGGTTNYLPKWSSATTLSSTSLVYDNGSSVGIGTSTPVGQLNVHNGSSNSSTFILTHAGTSSGGLWIQSDNLQSYIINYEVTPLKFAVGGADVMKLQPGGNVGIGVVGVPTQRLDVVGNIQFTGALMPGSSAGTAGQLLQSNGPGVAPSWVAAPGSNNWSLTGNTGTNASTNFIGTNDNVPLVIKTNGQQSGRIDQLTSNTFLGYWSGLASTGIQNTAMGVNSLIANTTGTGNTALGVGALQTNSTGTSNTAIGAYADVSSSGLTNATAIGASALATQSNTVVLGNNARVGIGTSAPSSGLEVAGSSMWTSAVGINNTGGGNDWRIGSDTDGGLKFVKANGATTTPFILTPTSVVIQSELSANGGVGSSGQVLTSQGAGLAPTWTSVGGLPAGTINQTLYHNGTNWTANSNVKSDGLTMSISKNVATTPINTADLFVQRISGDFGNYKYGVFSYREGNSGNRPGGSGWAYNFVDAAIGAYSNWGNRYSAAIYGHQYGDYGHSGAVVGYMSVSSIMGAVAYKDSTSIGERLWGLYTPNNTFIGGALHLNNALNINENSGVAGQVLQSNGAGVAPSWVNLSGSLSGGTTNYLPKWTSATTLSSTSLVYDDGANVGINTTGPTARLDVSGDFAISGDGQIRSNGFSAGAGPRIQYGYNTSASGGFGSIAVGYNSTASGTVSVALGQSVTASGYGSIAIGQSVTSSGPNAVALGFSSSAAATASTVLGYGANTIAGADYSMGIGLNNSSFNITSPNVMAVMGGKVGIGLTTPITALHVHSTSGSGNLQLTSGGTGTANSDGFILSNDGGANMFMMQQENADWYFTTLGGSIAMTIAPSARIGMGTTTPNAATKLHVSLGDIGLDNNRAISWLTTGGVMSTAIRLDNTNALNMRGLGGGVRFLDSGGSDIVMIGNNGYIGIGTTNPTLGGIHINSTVDNTKDDIYVNGNYPFLILNSLANGNGGVNFLEAGTSMGYLYYAGGPNLIKLSNDPTGAADHLVVNSVGNVGVGTATISANARLSIYDGHLQSKQPAAPTIAAGAAAGTGATATIVATSSDVAGQFTITLGNALWAAGTQATITFNKPYATAPRVILMPVNSAAAAAVNTRQIYTPSGVNSFTVAFNNPGAGIAVLTFNYMVIEN